MSAIDPSPLSKEESDLIFGPDVDMGLVYQGIAITQNDAKEDWHWWDYLDSQAAREWLTSERLRVAPLLAALDA